MYLFDRASICFFSIAFDFDLWFGINFGGLIFLFDLSFDLFFVVVKC